SVMDSGRHRGEVVSLQNLLQRISGSRVARGPDSDQNARIRRRQFQMLSLAQTLSRFIPNTNGCMSTNSPCTRPEPRSFTRRRTARATFHDSSTSRDRPSAVFYVISVFEDFNDVEIVGAGTQLSV